MGWKDNARVVSTTGEKQSTNDWRSKAIPVNDELTELSAMSEGAADIPLKERAIVKNLAVSPEAGAEYLRSKGYDAIVSDNEIIIYNPKDGTRKYLDPKEIEWQDLVDIAYDVPAAALQTGATVAGGLSAGIPGAMLASGASGGVLEYLRQKLGQYAGIKQEVDPMQVGLVTGVSAITPGVFGSGATANQIIKRAAARGIAPEALEQANRSLVTRGVEKVAPSVASYFSGVPKEDITNYMATKGAAINVGKAETDELSEKAMTGLGKLKEDAEAELQKTYPSQQQGIPVNQEFAPSTFYQATESISNARIELDEKIRQGIATKADFDAAKKEAELEFKMAQKEAEANHKLSIKEAEAQKREIEAQLKAELKMLEQQQAEAERQARAEFAAAQKERAEQLAMERKRLDEQNIFNEATKIRQGAQARLKANLGEGATADAGLTQRMADIHKTLVDSFYKQKAAVGEALGQAIDSSTGTIKTADLLKPIDDAIATLRSKATAATPRGKQNIEALIQERQALAEGLPEVLTARQAFDLQDVFKVESKFSKNPLAQRRLPVDDQADLLWKQANAKAYGVANKKLEEVAGTQGIKDQYKSLIQLQDRLENEFTDPDTMYKAIASSDKPGSLFTRQTMEDVKSITGGKIDLKNEIQNIKDHSTLFMPDEKVVNKKILQQLSESKAEQDKAALKQALKDFESGRMAENQKYAENVAKIQQSQQLTLQEKDAYIKQLAMEHEQKLASMKPKEVSVTPTMSEEEIAKNRALLAKMNRMYADQAATEKTLGTGLQAQKFGPGIGSTDVDEYLMRQGIPVDQYRQEAMRIAADNAKKTEAELLSRTQEAERQKLFDELLSGKRKLENEPPALAKYKKANQIVGKRFSTGENTSRTLLGLEAPTKAYTKESILEVEDLLGIPGDVERLSRNLRTASYLKNPAMSPISSGGVTATARSNSGRALGLGAGQLLAGPTGAIAGSFVGDALASPAAMKSYMDSILKIQGLTDQYLPEVVKKVGPKVPAYLAPQFSPWVKQNPYIPMRREDGNE